MTENTVLFVGVGGKGVLTIGELLAQAGISQYACASWTPTYGVQMRGGEAACIVILSDDKIASPILNKVETMVAMAPGSYENYEDRLNPGGILIYESTGQVGRPKREDITSIAAPATEMAIKMGDARLSNMILLGAFIASTKMVPPHYVEEEIDGRFMDKKEKREEGAVSPSVRAFREGIKLAAEYK